MRIITVVGVRGSGKTTVTEALLKELGLRGVRAGTVKTIFCPTFHMDKPGSNTSRHIRAGAALVTARAETETTFMYPYRMKASEILGHYAGCGAVIFEGDYELPAPRVVTAHAEKDARERLNEHTICVSGRFADTADTLDGLPVLHPIRDIGALADLVLAQEDVTDLTRMDRTLTGEDLTLSRAFCAQGCRGHLKSSGVTVTVGSRALRLTKEQEAAVLRWARENAREEEGES